MNASELYGLLVIDKELVAIFFIVFSRFEYALKRTIKYAKKDRYGGAMADWKKFAKNHNSAFKPEQIPELKSAVDYIHTKPPKKQVIREGVLGWEEDVEHNDTSRLEQTLCAVRRVRNNLFHGGKFPMVGPVEDPGRDTILLESCMTILEECLKLDDEVRNNFESFDT